MYFLMTLRTLMILYLCTLLITSCRKRFLLNVIVVFTQRKNVVRWVPTAWCCSPFHPARWAVCRLAWSRRWSRGCCGQRNCGGGTGNRKSKLKLWWNAHSISISVHSILWNLVVKPVIWFVLKAKHSATNSTFLALMSIYEYINNY